MLRERKRDPKEWPIKAYKYRVYPNGQLPQLLWDIAVEQRRLWNEFCLIREKYNALIKPIKEDTTLDKTVIKEKTVELFKLMDREILAAAKLSKLNWSCYSEMVTRFQLARVKGATKLKYGMKEINIPHVITGGGEPVDKIFTNRNLARTIKPLDPSVYDNNAYDNRRSRYSKGILRISLGDLQDNIHYRINLQQEIDSRSFIKRINWVGKYSVFGWEWYLVVTLEEPAKTRLTSLDKIAAIDTGWRKFDEYIRVGLLADQDGRVVEFRLPLNVYSSHCLKKERKGKLNTFDHADRIKWLSDTWAYQAEIDQLLEDTKAQLKPLLPSLKATLPADHYLEGIISHFQKVRNIGLNKLTKYLQANPQSNNEMLNILEVWQRRSLYMRRTLYSIQRRIATRRKEIYLNMAHWIFRNYSQVVWEGDLAVKKMIEEEDLPYALENAAKYRQYTAPGSFREIIKRVQAKYTGVLHPTKAKDTTTTCAICGATVKTGSKLVLECENGHKLDQDINASLVIGQRLYKDIFAYDKISKRLGKKSKQAEIYMVKNHQNYVVQLEL